MAEVFADRMQVTMDRMAYRGMRDLLSPILNSLGASVCYDRPESEEGLWKIEGGGTFKAAPYGQVVGLGASGQFLSALRAGGTLGEWLHTLGTEPHKVTVLDATQDYPEDAPPVVQALYKRATTSPGIQLSRKRVRLTDVSKMFSQREDGRESGTVYVGSRQANTRLKVYDKQHERFYHGVDASPGVRFELTLKAGNLTLADVYNPTAVYWHYMSDVLPVPEGVTPWVAGAMGYNLPRRPVLSDLDQLRRRLMYSADIAAVVKLADRLPGGRATLLGELAFIYPRSCDS
jgi:hypothetical protein